MGSLVTPTSRSLDPSWNDIVSLCQECGVISAHIIHPTYIKLLLLFRHLEEDRTSCKMSRRGWRTHWTGRLSAVCRRVDWKLRLVVNSAHNFIYQSSLSFIQLQLLLSSLLLLSASTPSSPSISTLTAYSYLLSNPEHHSFYGSTLYTIRTSHHIFVFVLKSK